LLDSPVGLRHVSYANNSSRAHCSIRNKARWRKTAILDLRKIGIQL
jgi:hypothetical protein